MDLVLDWLGPALSVESQVTKVSAIPHISYHLHKSTYVYVSYQSYNPLSQLLRWPAIGKSVISRTIQRSQGKISTCLEYGIRTCILGLEEVCLNVVPTTTSCTAGRSSHPACLPSPLNKVRNRVCLGGSQWKRGEM